VDAALVLVDAVLDLALLGLVVRRFSRKFVMLSLLLQARERLLRGSGRGRTKPLRRSSRLIVMPLL
jgi:hypothetical protein